MSEGQLRNRANSDEMVAFVQRIEELEDECLREKMTYMERARRIREQQKEVYDEAKDQGLSKKAMRAVVKARDHERKAADLRDDLEDDDAAIFDDVREALGDYGDTPLGAAAINKAEEKSEVVKPEEVKKTPEVDADPFEDDVTGDKGNVTTATFGTKR